MIGWTLDRIAQTVGGRLIGADAPIRGVSNNSRAIEPGALYVALRGDRFDGHDFTQDAIDAGAAGVLVERTIGATPAILIDDSLKALADLASAYRSTLDATVIGVTGSSGKTTTCRLIDAALSTLTGTSSIKSFNNSVGLPLTILRAHVNDDYLLCEMGTSSPGEIARLSAIARPDIGVITSIGRAHLERLGDLDGVRREKSAIDGKLILIPADEDALREHLPADAIIETVEPAQIEVGAEATRFAFSGETYSVPLVGAHHAHNAAFAVRVARELGVASSDIRAGLSQAKPPSMRFEPTTIADVTIVNDAYNANPESTAASLRAFCEAHAEAPRRVAVLGDMLELGPHAHAAHAEIAERVEELPIDAVIAVGPETSRALGSDAAASMEALDAARILDLIQPGDAVLLKGSRGIGLERVLDAWRERCAEGAGA